MLAVGLRQAVCHTLNMAVGNINRAGPRGERLTILTFRLLQRQEAESSPRVAERNLRVLYASLAANCHVAVDWR